MQRVGQKVREKEDMTYPRRVAPKQTVFVGTHGSEIKIVGLQINKRGTIYYSSTMKILKFFMEKLLTENFSF